jgi:hypothetical protein
MRRQRKKKEGGRRQTGSSRRHVTEDMSFSPLVSLYAAASGPSSYNLEKEEGRHGCPPASGKSARRWRWRWRCVYFLPAQGNRTTGRPISPSWRANAAGCCSLGPSSLSHKPPAAPLDKSQTKPQN